LTINKSIGELTTLDGSFDKTLKASEQLKDLPQSIQKYMLFGNYQIGNAKKFDSHSIFDDVGSIDGFIAQFVNLDEAQQKAFLSLSSFDEKLEKHIKDTKNAVQTGEKFNSQLFEQIASQKDGITTGVLNEFMKAGGLKDAKGVLALPNTQDAIALMEDYANHCSDASKTQQLFNAGILEQENGVYKLSQAFLKEISVKQASTVATVALTAAQKAWNVVAQYGKQLLLSLGVAAVTFIATKLVDYIMNLKTHSEELVDAMNDSHEAAQQATKDVEEIQSKIDELNKSLKDAGVDKIEDIVDPAERERLQAINDMLQAQLELKKQLEKDANDKANADTSAVVNDKTEDSIVKTRTVNVSYAEGGANAGAHQVAEKVSKTESLEEHTAALNDLIDKRRELATAGKEDTQEYKDNEAAIASETEKVEGLSSAVSKQMDSYETDADSFAQYKDEYVAGTNAMTAATKALANAQGDTSIDTTNLDIFSEKVRQIKNDIDNGDSKQSDWEMFNGLGAFSGMTGESIINIDKDTANQTDAEKTALEKLHQVADDNKISFENLIGVFEAFGIIQTSNASSADSYAEQLEKTMSVIDDIQSAYKTCSSAVEEYNKYRYMSVDSLQSLLQMDDEYLNTLELVNGKLQVNQSAYADLLATQYAQAQMEAISQAISELNAIAKGDAAEKAETFTEATEDEKNKLEALAPALKNATIGTGELAGALAAARSAENGDNTEEIEAKISSIMNALNTRLSLISTNMQNAMNGASGLKNQLNGFSDSANKSSGAAQTFLDAWSTLTSAMKEFNDQNYLSMQTVQDLTGLEDKYTSLLKKNDVTGKLEIQTSKFQDLMEAELKEAKIKGDNATASQYNKILEWTGRNIQKQTMSYWDLVAAIEGYSAALEEAKGITDTFKDAWDNGKTVKEKTEKSRTGALDYEGTEAQSSALQDLLKYSEYDPTLIEKAYNQETGKIDLSGDTLKTAVVASLREQAKAARTEGGAAADAIAASYEKSANNIEGDVISVQDYFDGLGSTIDEINEKIDDMQSAWTDLNDVTNEYNIYDGLSVDAFQKLLTMSPEYLACLQLEGGQLSVNADLMKDMLIKQLETKAALLESKDETRDQAKILREMIAQLEKNGISALSGLDQYAKNLEDTLSNIKSLFSDLLGVFEQANTDKSNDLKIQGDAWLEVIDKRIDALNEQNDAQERAIELSKAQDALEKAKANKTVHVYHAGGSGFEWEADQNAVRDAQSTLDDTIRKNRKEDEIERLNKLKEAVQENNELIGSSFEDYEKKKKYLAEFDKMTYDDMISYNENWKNSILGNMKSTQVVTNVNEIITKIEKLITTLETLNNVLTWISTLGKSTDGGGLTGLFSNGGLLSKVGKFFNIASEDGLGAALNQTGEWFSGKLSAALEANPNNPIIKAFSNLWTAVGEGASKFFTETSGTGLGGIIKTGIEKAGTLISGLGGSNGVLGTIATTVKTGIGSIGTALTGGSSAIPVIGPIIAVAVNNAVQQFGKISKENTKIWADQNSTTGEKIVSSVGNVLYHLSPVEGWDKSIQYAKMAAEGEGLWQKLEYGAKSLYYATGLGTMLDNIWSTIKSILKVFGVKFKEKDDGVSTSSSVSGKKGVGSWKIWPWNWGKKAKGDKKIKKSAPYNVDEEGDEIIVRKPQTGRMTYLEKGDGVIPANETENLMTIGKNPLKWLTENVGKILGASAAKDVVEGKVDEGAVTKASKVLASSVVNTFSSAWNSVKMSTEDLIDSMNDSFQGGSTSVTTAAGTILSRVKTMFGKFNMGKLLGSFSSGVSGAISKSAKEYSSTTELLSGTKSKTIDTMNKMRSTFENTWASVAKETGVSKDKITSISSEMFSKMETLVNQTYDAIDSNAGMSSDQLNDITKSLFQSMQSIYTSGWNAVYATSTGMSQETANTLNSAYKSSSDGCTQAMNTIRNTMVGSWEQCGGGVQNLANGTYQTLSKAWADSSGSAEKMLYDTRACFDSGWGAVEQGVSNLANNPKDKLSTAWAEITSQSNATFGAEGTLKTDADNAWKNVEPGATNLSKNMQWTMDQAYLATKQGCSDTVNSVNTNLNSTSAGFSAIASAIDAVNKKASDSEEVAKNTGHAWYEWVLNPVGTLLDTVTKYNTEDKSKNNFLQNAVHTVTHPISSVVESVKYLGNAAKDFFGGLFGKHASGLKSASKNHLANVDELGPELLVRKPQSGRYTYLETGDGVVPADITSKLFEMGGNPNKWFSEQMAKYGSQAITTKSTGNTSFSTGNIVINNPVGNSEDLASEIKKNFSTRMAQEWNKR
jgi:hypothetical protein